ncbi:Uncharacterised protein [Serratia fonticola]|uniref:Uncharacterized protein n=1 Tax=Serratia fonticola TaxID=47917 RepID=A0A4U9WJ45_SERFO|nr:Uncharacterised protein [Serratia fonticola]
MGREFFEYGRQSVLCIDLIRLKSCSYGQDFINNLHSLFVKQLLFLWWLNAAIY